MIATITPASNTQTNLLANALNGTSGSLAQALNAAIQRSQLDLQVQAQQNQTLVTEQARNLAREQQETFDLRNRAENLIQIGETQRINDSNIALTDARTTGITADNEFEASERGILIGAGATPASQSSFGFENTKTDDAALREAGANAAAKTITEHNFRESEREKTISSGNTPADIIAKKESRIAEDRTIDADARKLEEQERKLKEAERLKGVAEEEKNTRIQEEIDNEVGTWLMWGFGIENVKEGDPTALKSAIQTIDKSTVKDTPDAIKLRNQLEAEYNKLTSSTPTGSTGRKLSNKEAVDLAEAYKIQEAHTAALKADDAAKEVDPKKGTLTDEERQIKVEELRRAEAMIETLGTPVKPPEVKDTADKVKDTVDKVKDGYTKEDIFGPFNVPKE